MSPVPSPTDLFPMSAKAKLRSEEDEVLEAILFTVDGRGAEVKRAAFEVLVQRLNSRHVAYLALLGVISHGPNSDNAD